MQTKSLQQGKGKLHSKGLHAYSVCKTSLSHVYKKGVVGKGKKVIMDGGERDEKTGDYREEEEQQNEQEPTTVGAGSQSVQTICKKICFMLFWGG